MSAGEFVGEWNEAGHGHYITRSTYDMGPHGDNWAYIDPKTLRIVDYQPEFRSKEMIPRKKPLVIAGPFPTLQAAKAAYLVLYGR